jgi:hypothetical protein
VTVGTVVQEEEISRLYRLAEPSIAVPVSQYLLVSETLDDPFTARPGKWSDQDYEESKVKCIPARHVWKTRDVQHPLLATK